MRSRTALFLTVIFLPMLIACSSKDPHADLVSERNKTNIQKVSNAYVLFCEFNGYIAPAEKEEYVSFVENLGGVGVRSLDMMGIKKEEFSDYFVSEVDGQPFKIRWSVKYSPTAPPFPVAFEKEGADGVRRVGLTNGKVIEVSDDKKYNELLDGKISKEDWQMESDEEEPGT